MNYDGQAAFDEVLRPWLENNIPAIEQLRSLGASSGGVIPPMPGEALWFLYSVHRVLELLVLRFQTFSPGGSNEQGPAITLGEFFRFARGIGADILNPRPWSPFHHEIVGLAPTSPDMRPQGLRQHWPCLMLGPLLLMRAGVTVPAGAARLVPGIADRSMLFWAYRRNSRRHNDLAHGWGANSSWRTPPGSGLKSELQIQDLTPSASAGAVHRITANRLAIATACVRLFAFNFMLMFRRCVRTVLSDTNSFSAIALLE